VLMYALAASCEELRARTGNPSSDMNSAIVEKSMCALKMHIL
jgi:hypothetical protein